MEQRRANVPDGPGPTLVGQSAARRLAWLLGFALPLSGGLPLSQWIAGYPDQLTPIRVVTVAVLCWLATQSSHSLPSTSRRMIAILAAGCAYGLLTLLWTPNAAHGIHDLVTVAMALATGVAVILLAATDHRALPSFAAGLLIAAAIQVLIALAEVRSGVHLSHQFGAIALEEWQLSGIESLIGSTAWGTLGNPNDLGGFWLMSLAVFLSAGAYGLRLRKLGMVAWWGLIALGVYLGFTALADARAFRLGVAILVGMRVLDRLVPPRSVLRVPAVVFTVAMALVWLILRGPVLLESTLAASQSDSLRLQLIESGLTTALVTGGFGRGIGAEKAQIDTGELVVNYHNVVAQLAAELGLVLAAGFLLYLLGLLTGWALATKRARAIGDDAARARASLAVSLMVYGFTSSGVLESPQYWAFFALTAVLADRHRKAEGLAEVDPLQPSLPDPSPTVNWAEHDRARLGSRSGP